MLKALTGSHMPGKSLVIAEGNSLGRGPVIFHLSPSGIAMIRKHAAGELHPEHMNFYRMLDDPIWHFHVMQHVSRRQALFCHISNGIMTSKTLADKGRQSSVNLLSSKWEPPKLAISQQLGQQAAHQQGWPCRPH